MTPFLPKKKGSKNKKLKIKTGMQGIIVVLTNRNKNRLVLGKVRLVV